MEEGQIITLDNNKDYILIKRIIDNNTTYDYLLSAEKPIEALFVKEERNSDGIFFNELEKEELNRIINLFEN